MAVRVLFFAQCADWMRRRELTVELRAPDALSRVLEAPDFAPIRGRLGSLRAAVNREYADFSSEVRDGDEIAVFPPVCGG